MIARYLRGRHLSFVKGDHRRAQPGGRAAQLIDVLGVVDRSPQRERRSGLGHQQVPVAEHPENLAVGPDHRHMVDVAVEHLEHDLVAKALGADGERRRAHDLGHRASASTLPATTRSRRSLSVTIPSPPSGSRTRAALAPASAMRPAASRTVSRGSHTIGRSWTSRATGSRG